MNNKSIWLHCGPSFRKNIHNHWQSACMGKQDITRILKCNILHPDTDYDIRLKDKDYIRPKFVWEKYIPNWNTSHQTSAMLESESYHDANFDIIMTTSSATSDDKVGIITTLGFHLRFCCVVYCCGCIIIFIGYKELEFEFELSTGAFLSDLIFTTSMYIVNQPHMI